MNKYFNRHIMKNQNSARLKTNRIIASSITILGIALITYMVKVEGELGALPLFLVIAGIVWLFVTQSKINKHLRKNE